VTRLLIWFLVFPRLARWALYLAAWTGLLVTAIAAAPVTTVTVTGLLIAWGWGWPPVRLRRAAAWSLPMTATWLTVTAITTHSLSAVLAAPFTGWAGSWHAFSYGATTTAFVLAAPLRGPGVTRQAVLDATDYLCAAIEIIDSRIADWKITLADTIADNASSAGVVLGTRRVPPRGLDLAVLVGRTLVGGQVAERGLGSAVLGHPADAVAWLANVLGERGVTLKAGHVVLPGAFARAVDVRPGDRITADIDEIGTAEVEFT